MEESQRIEWEEYAATHNGWVGEFVAVQSRDRTYKGPEITDIYLEENYNAIDDWERFSGLLQKIEFAIENDPNLHEKLNFTMAKMHLERRKATQSEL